jgi:hypothetical protein
MQQLVKKLRPPHCFVPRGWYGCNKFVEETDRPTSLRAPITRYQSMPQQLSRRFIAKPVSSMAEQAFCKQLSMIEAVTGTIKTEMAKTLT